MSEIGICIPTRNQSAYIPDALRSAFAQTTRPCDVVVSDDAGTDDTSAVVEAFRQTLAPELRGLLRCERSDKLLGIGGNFDRAVRLAKGEFVVKLDSDDLLEADFVARLSEGLQANPKAGWAHGNVMNIHPDQSPIGLAHARKVKGFYDSARALSPYLRHNDTCHCVMLRKSAYLEVGGYRANMKTCEDWLLWLEMIFAGWGYYFYDKPLAKMRKYVARPELMTRRRADFITSIRVMTPIVEAHIRKALPSALGQSREEAIRRYRSSAARLCIRSGYDEGDSQVRRSLFEAAYELYPSLGNQFWLYAGPACCAPVTRFFEKAAGLPRNTARRIYHVLRTQ